MNKISIEDVKKLREKTSAGIMDCRKALDEAGGDMKKAEELLNAWGIEKAAKKSDRATAAGAIHSYIHHGGKVGALIELNCETDFVARTDEFQKLAGEIAMQVASMNPKDVDELVKQPYIRDSKLTIEDLVKSAIGKIGENITIKRFIRFELGN